MIYLNGSFKRMIFFQIKDPILSPKDISLEIEFRKCRCANKIKILFHFKAFIYSNVLSFQHFSVQQIYSILIILVNFKVNSIETANRSLYKIFV